MKNFASDEEKFDFIYSIVQKITDAVTEKGAYCFDVVIEDKKIGAKDIYTGKAFSLDGTDFYGFTYGGDYETLESIPQSLKSAIFAGSYVDEKGLSLNFLPYHYINLGSPNTNFAMNVTNRPGKKSLYGKKQYNNVKATVIPYIENDVGKMVSLYLDMLAQITSEYIDKAVLIAEKAESQDENIALINKLYEQFKGIPIPSCFTEDGAVPKTKI